jgi:thiol:disulfide interchange protein
MTRTLPLAASMLLLMCFLTGCPLSPPIDPATQPAWLDSLDGAKAEAAASDKRIIFFAHLDTCPSCQTMFRETWADEDVRAASEGFVMLSLEGREHPGVLTAYGITRVPRTLVLLGDGSVLEEHPGFLNAAEMLDILENAAL